MDILIIGGTGYMGKTVVQRLLERGDRVTVFSRGSSRPDWWDRVEHIQGDREDRPDFMAKLKGKAFDAVIDSQVYRMEDVESTVETFRGNIGRYLLVSTGSVYLEGTVDFFNRCPYNESDVDWTNLEYTYPQGQDPYAVGKRHCEKWLQENGGVPFTIVRVPAVMGLDDPTGRMWWWVQRALDGRSVIIPTDARGLSHPVFCRRRGQLHPGPGCSKYSQRHLLCGHAGDYDHRALGRFGLACRRPPMPDRIRS